MNLAFMQNALLKALFMIIVLIIILFIIYFAIILGSLIQIGDFNVNSVQSSLTPKWNITVCVMLRNVLPYVVEWIEFHKLQGVDHFVLYDDNSDDELRLLPLLYESVGDGDLIDIFPANFLRNSELSDHVGFKHDYNQRQSLSHCLERYRHRTEWMAFFDLDEFMYSPNHGTIKAFLKEYENNTKDGLDAFHLVSEFYVSPVRFGTSGLMDDFRVKLETTVNNSSTILSYEPFIHKNQSLYPILMEANPKRAPHPQIDNDYQLRYNTTCGNSSVAAVQCAHANGKSVFKPSRCSEAYIHWCGDLKGHSSVPPLYELRLDHFAWRSRESVSNLLSDWQGNKVIVYDQFDHKWFSQVYDVGNKVYIPKVREAVMRFPQKMLPRVTRLKKEPQWLIDALKSFAKNLTMPLFL